MSPLSESKEGIEGLKQQTASLKQGSVDATWNALQVGDQSGKVADTEHPSDSEGHSQPAEDKTVMMKQLNRFNPFITFNKDAKEANVQTQDEKRKEREKAVMHIREKNRLGHAITYGVVDNGDEEGIGGSQTMKTGAHLLMRKEQRKRLQFEAAAAGGEMEDELDESFDENSEMMMRLKALKSAMEKELAGMQVNCLTTERKRMSETKIGDIVKRNAEKLKRIK